MTHIKHKDTKEIAPEESCCADSAKQETSDRAESSDRREYSQRMFSMLAYAVVFLAVANIAVFGYFSYSVSKGVDTLAQAVKPVAGELVLILPENCDQCGDLSEQKRALLAQNIELSDDKTYAANGEGARELIQKNNVKRLPALIFVAEEKINEKIRQAAEGIRGRMQSDETIVVEPVSIPYVSADSGEVRGLVDITYIVDSSCLECYDVVAVQRSILQRFGMVFGTERMVDVDEAEGEELVERYTIEYAPTIVMSSTALEYKEFANAWKRVGTVESDQYLVFREMEAIGMTYRNMKTGEVVVKEKKEGV